MSDFVLEVLDGERAGEVISLGSERLTFGRRPNNDVVLKDEKASGNHAEVVREGDAWVLRDLDSRNGTFLDGRKVTEVSLSPGDVFKVGLTGIRFRRATDAPAVAAAAGGPDAAAAGFSVHRVDQARLQRVKGGRGMLPLVALLAVVAGAGAWVWVRYGGEREPGQASGGKKAHAAVPGNLLAADVATADQDAAWELSAGGVAFTIGQPAHSGSNALTATRGEGQAFALARLREPLRVLGDDTLELSAQVRAEGGGRVALRVLFSSSREDEPLTLTAGTGAGGDETFTPLVGTLAVPSGMDRVRVEVLALLPNADSTVSVDDVALVKSGAGKASALSAKKGVRSLTSGASLALVLAQDVLVQAITPIPSPGSPLAALDAAGRVTLAEAGGTLQASVQDDTFTLAVQGVDGFALELPSGEGLAIRAAADAAFAPATPDLAATATEILVGSGSLRVLLALPAPLTVQGRSVSGGYRVQLPGASEVRVVVGFEEQRRQARERVRAARDSVQRGRFAEALAALQEVVDRFPHDDAVLADVQQQRAEIQQGLSTKLDKLTQDLEIAKFFMARSGLVRVLADLDALVAAYGEANLGGANAGGEPLAARVRAAAGTMIADLDTQAVAQRAPGLRRLADALLQGGQAELAKTIETYLGQHERKQ